MLARKEENIEGKDLPQEWLDKVLDTISRTYQGEFDPDKSEFQIFGMAFSNEALCMLSILDKIDSNKAPVTCFISADLSEKTKMNKLLDAVVDAIGLFLDDYFSQKNWDSYQLNWRELDVKKFKLFVKITRENVALSIKANQLLNQ